MAVSYKKLWKLLIDKDIKKKRSQFHGWCQPCYYHKDGQGWACYNRSSVENLHCIRLWCR